MEGRAALVTGGSSGIGFAIARALGEDGYGVTLSARRPDKPEAAAKELGPARLRVLAAGGLHARHLDAQRHLRVAVLGEARLEHRAQGCELAVGGRAGARAGLRVTVPGLGEAREARATAATVRGEHRAHAAAMVSVGADDDPVGLDALEHRQASALGQAIDRDAKLLG